MSNITQRGQGAPLALAANGQFQQQAQSTTLYGGTATDTSLNSLLGSRWDLPDGRELRFVLAGASNLAVGKIMTAAAPVSDNVDLAVAAFTAYSNNGNQPAQVTVTLGASAVTANQYRGGYIVVEEGTGAGQTLQIASHPAASATDNVVITLADAPNTALTTSSKVTLMYNPCNGVIVSDPAALQQPVGATLYPITAANYGYVVSKGITGVLCDGAVTTGSAVSVSNVVAGAVEGGVIAQGFVGFAATAGVDTKYAPIVITL